MDPSTTLSSGLGPFAIQDKFFEERKAFAEGKTIEIWAGVWYYCSNPTWDNHTGYRVKPTEKKNCNSGRIKQQTEIKDTYGTHEEP